MANAKERNLSVTGLQRQGFSASEISRVLQMVKINIPPPFLISVLNTVAMLMGIDQIEPPMAGDEHSSVYS